MPVTLLGALSAGVCISLFVFTGRVSLLSCINLLPPALHPPGCRDRRTTSLLPVRVSVDGFSYSVFHLIADFFSSCVFLHVGRNRVCKMA